MSHVLCHVSSVRCHIKEKIYVYIRIAKLQILHVTIDVLLSEVSSVFIPEDYSRQRTRMAKSRMGEDEA